MVKPTSCRASRSRHPTACLASGKTLRIQAPCPQQTKISHLPSGSLVMGQISDKAMKRLGKNRKLMTELRRECGSIQSALDALRHGAPARLSHGVALDPLHAVYVAVQNVTSVFAERVSPFP